MASHGGELPKTLNKLLQRHNKKATALYVPQEKELAAEREASTPCFYFLHLFYCHHPQRQVMRGKASILKSRNLHLHSGFISHFILSYTELNPPLYKGKWNMTFSWVSSSVTIAVPFSL